MKKPENKHKLTPQVLKQIRTISKELPPLQKKDKLGRFLFRIITRGNRIYKDPILLNHEVELISAYQKYGETGMENYMKSVKNIVDNISIKI